MATKISIIYNRALSKMREYNFVEMEDVQIYESLSYFLQSAEADFVHMCAESLSLCDEGTYEEDLSEESIELLALGVVFHWLTAYVADADKLRNVLGTKDYSAFSPANLLNSIEALREAIGFEYDTKMNRYSYLHGDLIRPQVRR